MSIERDVPIDEIGEYLREPDYLVWVDVQDPGPAEIAWLMEEFGFHPLVLDDVASGQQRPKVEEYKGYLFVVTYGVGADQGIRDLQASEVDLVVGRNYLVSLHRGHIPALEDAYGRWLRGGTLLREGVGFLVYTVLESTISAYVPVVEAIEDELGATEQSMFVEFREETIQELLALKRTLFTLRHVLNPLREAFSLFVRYEQPIFSTNTRVYFRDLYDDILRILDLVDSEREMVSSALDAHLTVVSNRLNITMKRLTVISVCIGIVGSVFGAWGMNVGGIPMANHALGFWAIFGGMIALISAVLLFSWRHGWL